MYLAREPVEESAFYCIIQYKPYAIFYLFLGTYLTANYFLKRCKRYCYFRLLSGTQKIFKACFSEAI